jgi:hypothetical protein
MAQAQKTTRNTTRKAKPEAAIVETKVTEADAAEIAMFAEADAMNKQFDADRDFQVMMATTIKGCSGNTQKAKPQRKMLRKIAKMHNHPGTGLGIKRWHLYREGMTLQDAKLTPGLTHLDITFWEKHELVTMADCTDAEYDAAIAEWEAAKPKKAEEAPAEAEVA